MPKQRTTRKILTSTSKKLKINHQKVSQSDGEFRLAICETVMGLNETQLLDSFIELCPEQAKDSLSSDELRSKITTKVMLMTSVELIRCLRTIFSIIQKSRSSST